MSIQSMMMWVGRIIESTTSADELAAALIAVTLELGFEHYALTHHVDILAAGGAAIHLHNYPERWAEYYERHALGIADPIHRASHVTSVGFKWSRLPKMINLTAGDHRMLLLGRDQGIGDGFTIPVNVPGEARGSVSFVQRGNRPISEANLPIAQLAGNYAFEAARRLWLGRGQKRDDEVPELTDRQRDCALWVARGKSDWEISRILGVGEETVARHVKQGCARYGVNKRMLLVTRTLFDGTLTLSDIMPRPYSPFRE